MLTVKRMVCGRMNREGTRGGNQPHAEQIPLLGCTMITQWSAYRIESQLALGHGKSNEIDNITLLSDDRKRVASRRHHFDKVLLEIQVRGRKHINTWVALPRTISP